MECYDTSHYAVCMYNASWRCPAYGSADTAFADSTTLNGTVCTCGSTVTYNNIRTASAAQFVLDLTNKTATNLTISQLKTSNNSIFGGTTFSSLQSRTTATNLTRGTLFKMGASMAPRTGVGADNNWNGGFNY